MRGLPFPPDSIPFHREQSHDYSTYNSSTPTTPTPGLPEGMVNMGPPDGAPGDPRVALPFDHHGFPPNGIGIVKDFEVEQLEQSHPSNPASMGFPHYLQGPQGDPFAPQQQFPGYAHALDEEHSPTNIIAESRPIIKPPKRRRKPRREEDCGFCQGNDRRNRAGEPERMATCDECGRSGHPSCMELGEVGETLLEYPWKCMECKTCEVCQEKGDDDRMMFCDHCDRGWHTYCLNPPIDKIVEGTWHCPICPPVPLHDATPEVDDQPTEVEMQIDPALQMEIDPALRESSVASSSVAPPTLRAGNGRFKKKSRDRAMPPRNRKGKSRSRTIQSSDGEEDAPVAPEEDEDHDADGEGEDGSDEDAEIDVEGIEEDAEEDVVTIKSRSRRPAASKSSRRKSKIPERLRQSDNEDARSSPPPRPRKRVRTVIRSPSPQENNRPKMVVRLKLPMGKDKGKGKARADDIGTDDDNFGTRKGMFDDILNSEERDTSKTNVLNNDRDRFERSRMAADTKLNPPPPPEPLDISTPIASGSRFPLRSAIHQIQQQSISSTPVAASPSPSTPGPSSYIPAKFDPNVLRIRTIRFGPYDIQTWYDAPFPEEFSNIPDGRLWICEFCLKYMKSRFACQRHRLKCKCRHPPGDEIYRDGVVSIFEVDGRKNKIYCQNLCLLSKMFLDHKSLFYDVEPFLFYVITEVDEIGARFVGYFSKEKRNSKDLNLSCIMTLPVRQRQGWGNLLIDFSYLLSKKEKKCGTPERPLSALGAIGYQKYWTLAIMRYLQTASEDPRLEDISTATSLTLHDVYHTLAHLDFISTREESPVLARPSPGRSVKITRRKSGNPRKSMRVLPTGKDEAKSLQASNGNDTQNFVPPSNYVIRWEEEKVTQYLHHWEERGYLTLKPDKLKWTPFLLDMPSLKPTLTSTLVSAVANVVVDEAVKGPEVDIDVLGSSSSQRAVSEATSSKRTEEVKEQQVTDLPEKPSMDLDVPEVPAEVPPAPRLPSPIASPTPVQFSPSRAFNMLDALADVAIMTDVRSRPPVVEKMLSSRLSSSISTSSAQTDIGKDVTTPVLEESRASSQPLTPSTPMSPSRSSINGRPSSRRKLRSQPSPNVVIFSSPNREAQFPKIVENGTPKFNGENIRDLKPQNEPPFPLIPPIPRRQSPSHLSLDMQILNTPKEPVKEPNGDTPSYSAKKRRKPDSPVTSPTVPFSPDRPVTRRHAQAIAEETARSGRQTRSKTSGLAPGVLNGPSPLRLQTDIKAPPKLNGSVSSSSRRSRSRKGDCEDGVMEDAVGGSAISETSCPDVPMASPTNDPLQDAEVSLPSANDTGFGVANGHSEPLLPPSPLPTTNFLVGEPTQFMHLLEEADNLTKETVTPLSTPMTEVNGVPPKAIPALPVLVPEEEFVEGDDIDADGETDPDIDGQTDRDAEGESDPDAVM